VQINIVHNVSSQNIVKYKVQNKDCAQYFPVEPASKQSLKHKAKRRHCSKSIIMESRTQKSDQTKIEYNTLAECTGLFQKD
jgi:hypothetical protein